MAFSPARLVHYNYGQEYTLREHVVTRDAEEDRPLLLSSSDAALYASKEALYREHKSHPRTTASGQKGKKIAFVQPLRVGPECGSHILLTSEGHVAKVYDPLCYRFMDPYYERKVDVVSLAEYEFHNEALAYGVLDRAKLCGSVAPKYHGSWTITLADPTARNKDEDREVHLILIECIEGVAMSEVPVDDLRTDTKEAIIVKVIEALTDVKLRGVDHNDFEPYNIILPESYESMSFSASNQSSDGGEEHQVCIINFATSHTERVECSHRPNCLCCKCIADTHRNPLHFWAGTDKFSEYG